LNFCHRTSASHRRRRAGQSLVESCLVIFVMCLLFAGMLQLSQLLAGREILHHAAARGARAKTVGFNWWMVEKAILVAAIPNAGRMTEPAPPAASRPLQDWLRNLRVGAVWDRSLAATPRSSLSQLELARIPEFLAAENHLRASYVLNYEDWSTIHGEHPDALLLEDGSTVFSPVLEIHVRQQYPLMDSIPRKPFYSHDAVLLRGTAGIENHYPFYIHDQNL
jgi:hypothetical protein